MRRVVFWQDSNGCIFVLNHIGSEGSNAHPLVIEDITVVYARSRMEHSSSETQMLLRQLSYAIKTRQLKAPKAFRCAIEKKEPIKGALMQRRYGIRELAISIATFESQTLSRTSSLC